MKKVQATGFTVSVNYECSHCNTMVTLYNDQIPQKDYEKRKCQICNKSSAFEPICFDVSSVDAESDDKIRISDNATELICSAMSNLGFSRKESIDLINEVIEDGSNDLGVVLLKLVLSKVGQN